MHHNFNTIKNSLSLLSIIIPRPYQVHYQSNRKQPCKSACQPTPKQKSNQRPYRQQNSFSIFTRQHFFNHPAMYKQIKYCYLK